MTSDVPLVIVSCSIFYEDVFVKLTFDGTIDANDVVAGIKIARDKCSRPRDSKIKMKLVCFLKNYIML